MSERAKERDEILRLGKLAPRKSSISKKEKRELTPSEQAQSDDSTSAVFNGKRVMRQKLM